MQNVFTISVGSFLLCIAALVSAFVVPILIVQAYAKLRDYPSESELTVVLITSFLLYCLFASMLADMAGI